MTQFDFLLPENQPEEDADGPLVGLGEAAGGEIRAVADAEGRVERLEISPGLLRHSRHGGTVVDSATLATEVTRAVNAALDDLVRRAAAASVPGAHAVAGELNRVGADFQRAIDDVTTELERAERRLDGR
jgi:hypothetical protein